MTDEIITVSEAAKLLGITDSAVLKAIEREAIKAQKFGVKNWAVSRQSVLEYRSTRKPGPGRPGKSESGEDSPSL